MLSRSCVFGDGKESVVSAVSVSVTHRTCSNQYSGCCYIKSMCVLGDNPKCKSPVVVVLFAGITMVWSTVSSMLSYTRNVVPIEGIIAYKQQLN
jgi:hypothetical protein